MKTTWFVALSTAAVLGASGPVAMAAETHGVGDDAAPESAAHRAEAADKAITLDDAAATDAATPSDRENVGEGTQRLF